VKQENEKANQMNNRNIEKVKEEREEPLVKKQIREYLPGVLLANWPFISYRYSFCYGVSNIYYSVGSQYYNTSAVRCSRVLDPQLTNSIHQLADDAFGRTTSALNFDIAILTAIVAAFGVAIGFQYFSKQTELREALQRVEKAPEEMVSLFYKKQLSNLPHALFDSDNHRRRVTILSLLSNPQITRDHYSTLALAVQQELSFSQIFFWIKIYKF